MSQNESPTHWPLVFAFILAGMVAACQVGKAAIAVPLLQQDLGLSLVFASWIVGAFGAMGAAGGLFAGSIASLFEPRRTLIVGLCLIGTASIAGALAPDGAFLLATRMLEGCGFLATVLSVPRLIRMIAATRDNDRVFAYWSVYLPAGSAAMMLLGPLLAASGWRTLWFVNGALALVYAGIVARLPVPASRAPGSAGALANIVQVLRAPGPILLAVAFGIYTFHYFALTGLLPTLLVDRLGLSIHAAGLISAITVAANSFGNLMAGTLLRHGVALWSIALSGFLVIGATGFAIFSPDMPVVAIAVVTSITLAVSGLIPASIFAAAPRLAPNSALLAITLGLMMNGSNLGQLLGPAALAAFVQQYGWERAPLVFVGVTIAGIAIALILRAVLRRPAQ